MKNIITLILILHILNRREPLGALLHYVWITILERKERDGRKERGEKRRKLALVCIGGNGRERKEDGNFPFKSFQF